MNKPANIPLQSSSEILTSIVVDGKEELAPDYFEAVHREADEELGKQLHRLRLEHMGDEVIVRAGDT